MECQLAVIPVLQSSDQSDLCTPLLLQINTQSQRELTEAGTTYNKWQITITMARAYLTTTAHGSHFHATPSCYVQSGIHLPGLSHRDADITKLTCKHLIPQSYVPTEAVPFKCRLRQWHYSCTSFYCCCLSKGAYIESNLPLKGANCSKKIVTAIAWRWLAASSGVGSQ